MVTRKRSHPTPRRSAADHAGAVAGAPVLHGNNAGNVQRAIYSAISGGEVLSVGVLNLVRTTLVTALAGARDVGAEAATTAVSAVRGSIRAAEVIGADLGMVAKNAIRGTIEAAEQIGGDLGGVARSATRGAVKATGDVGGDVALVARRAVEGTAEAARMLGADVVAIARSAAQAPSKPPIGSAARPAARCAPRSAARWRVCARSSSRTARPDGGRSPGPADRASRPPGGALLRHRRARPGAALSGRGASATPLTARLGERLADLALRARRSPQAVGHAPETVSELTRGLGDAARDGSSDLNEVAADVARGVNRAARSTHEGGSDLTADVLGGVQRLDQRPFGQVNDAHRQRLRGPDRRRDHLLRRARILFPVRLAARHMSFLSS